MTDVYVTKGILYEILGTDALKFAQFLICDNEEAKALKLMYSDMVEINLNSNVIKYGVIPLLKSYSVISEETEANINAYVASKLNV